LGYDSCNNNYSKLNSVTYSNLTPGTYFIWVNIYYGGYGSYTISNQFTPVPTTNFNFIQNLYTFSFTNNTLNGKSYSWDFGDGNSSEAVNPLHTYAKPGVYDVCLTATNEVGSKTFCSPVSIKGINSVVMNKAGNTGDATIYVYGGGFTPATTFKLSRSGYDDIIPNEIVFPKLGLMRGTLDIRDKATGTWDVVVEIPGDTTMTLENGFTIEEGNSADPWVNIIGRDRTLFGRWQTYTIAYGNNGNVDATGVPIWLAFSNDQGSGLEIEFVDFTVDPPEYTGEFSVEELKSLPIFFETDSLFGETFSAKVYPLYIPIIPAGQTESVRIRIKTQQDIRVMAWMNKPYFQSDLNVEAAQCALSVLAEGIVDIGTGAIPVVGCLHSVGKLVYNPYADAGNRPKTSWGSWLWNTAVTVVDCGINLSGAGAVVKGVGIFVVNMHGYASAFKECREAYKNKSTNDKKIRAVSSLDPNEIVGRAGYGINNYTLPEDAFPYTIFFENKSSATAPAQEVFVDNILDASVFDLSTFSLGPIGYGDTIVTPLPGLKEFSTDVDLRPGKNIILRICARVDTSTGAGFWKFTSLDPVTMDLTEDPMGGFLPPNITSPEGEGFVSYSVNLKSSADHGDEIKNKAAIVFDLNEPIVTNEYINIIDTEKPESRVLSAQQLNDTTAFELVWGGNDNESGIRYYTIYVAQNDSAFVPLLSDYPDTWTTFTGQPDQTYYFYSVAEDNLGNVETAPAGYDLKLDIGAKPEANFTVSNQTPCSGTAVSFTNLSTGSISSCLWSFGDGDTSSDSNPTHTYNNSGTYTVTLTVTDSSGCTDDDQVTITVNPCDTSCTVTANAGSDVSVCSGTCATLNGSASGGSSPYTYSWSPANGLSNPNIANPEACPDTTTSYTLTVTDNNGCSVTGQVIVTVRDCPIEVEPGQVKIQGGKKGYVNPVSGEKATIIFEPKESGKVTIRIYTLRGRLVWEKTEESVNAGKRKTVDWDCKNTKDEMVASGTYLVHIKGAGIDAKKKVVVIK
ncbi:PKD domain-containing protein, partial [bacterium]|nr:PKD domain-containing protein [bacterium]